MTKKPPELRNPIAVLGALALAFALLTNLEAASPPTDAAGNGDTAIVHLGTARDKGRVVEGIAIIHYKKGYGRPPSAGSGGGNRCFAFLAKGARWKTTEPYAISPANTRSLDEPAVRALTATSLATWDAAETSPFTVFGAEDAAATVDGVDTASPDGKNEVLFGDVSSPGAIAVTIVWGIFSGPVFARELVEWDALFDDVDFDWSTDGSAGKMDFQNIATHEFGHAAGMGHPDDSCTEETMYRFAGLGETKKRDLNAGDIAGINELY